MIIYKATNLINGKSYIGQTIHNLEGRIKRHIQHSESNFKKHYFQNALAKYGPENFNWEVIDECDNIEWLSELEKYYIYYYDTYNNGYNLTIGGDGSFIPSEETRKKMSKSMTGIRKKPLTENHKKKIGNSIKGNKHSEETKRKIGKGNKGKKRTEEHIRKMRKSLTGRKLSEEHKNKLSEARRGILRPYLIGKSTWNKGMNKKQMNEYIINKNK